MEITLIDYLEKKFFRFFGRFFWEQGSPLVFFRKIVQNRPKSQNWTPVPIAGVPLIQKILAGAWISTQNTQFGGGLTPVFSAPLKSAFTAFPPPLTWLDKSVLTRVLQAIFIGTLSSNQANGHSATTDCPKIYNKMGPILRKPGCQIYAPPAFVNAKCTTLKSNFWPLQGAFMSSFT